MKLLRVFCAVFCLLFSVNAFADKPVVKDILYCFNVGKSIGKTPFGVSAYTEFTIDQNPTKIGYQYSMLSFNYRPLNWLTTSLNGGYTSEAGVGKWMHDLTLLGKVPAGPFKLMFRQKIIHLRNSQTHENSGLARFRAQISYPIPNTKLTPSLAQDTYFWSQWKRTSIITGINWAPNKVVSLSCMYMASLMQYKNMHHLVVFAGINF